MRPETFAPSSIETLEPTPGQIAEAVGAIKKHGAGAVFFEPQFDEAAGKLGNALGPEEQEYDDKTYDQLWHSDRSKHLSS